MPTPWGPHSLCRFVRCVRSKHSRDHPTTKHNPNWIEVDLMHPELNNCFDIVINQKHVCNVILVKGTTCDSHFRAYTTRKIKNPKNTDIKNTEVNVEEELANDPQRLVYWLLILPEGYAVDKTILSEDHCGVKRSVFINNEIIKEKNKEYKFSTTWVQWEIALKGKGIKVAGTKNDNDELANLFADA